MSLVSYLSSLEMVTATRVQILDKSDCISHSTNTLGKGMNSFIHPQAMSKLQGRLVLSLATSQEEEKLSIHTY